VKSYYGKWITVKYQELSKEGVPRFPVGIDFRPSSGDSGVE
jgi:hypothetical protein